MSRTTFYRWYRRYRAEGLEGLTLRPATGQRYWNRIPPDIRRRVVELALAVPERTPRELAWQFTDREGHFLSESSIYRILKASDLITSPAFGQRWSCPSTSSTYEYRRSRTSKSVVPT